MQLIIKIILILYSTTKKIYLICVNNLCTFFYKKQFGKCGQDIHVYFPSKITGTQFIEIGRNVHINKGSFIRAEGGLLIGNNVHIARNITIYTVNHNYNGNALPYDSTSIKKPVTIGNNVWIGINVTIIPGVTIGDGAIIGAGTVVSKDIPKLAIVGSAPLRIIKYRDPAHYQKLVEMNQYGGVNGQPYQSIEYEEQE